MRIVYHQELRPRVVKVSHEFGLAGAPMSSELQPQCREQLVAQSLLIFNVFRSRNRKHRRRTHPLGHVADAHRFPAPWIGDDHMPAPFVPGITEHRLKPLSKRGFDEQIFAKEGMGHGSGSSRIVRTGKTRTGRSGSASGTASGSVTRCVIDASTLANRSTTSAV